MADTRKITIEIIQKSEGEDTPTPTPDNTGSNTTEKKKTDSEGKTLLKSVILNQGYNTAKQMVIQSVEASVNRYMTLTEDYMAQNTYNKVKTSISKAVSAGSAIIGGAVSGGQVAGPAGAAVGAIIGTIGYASSEFISYQSRMSSYNSSLNASNISIDYARRRAGLTDGSRGTEN